MDLDQLADLLDEAEAFRKSPGWTEQDEAEYQRLVSLFNQHNQDKQAAASDIMGAGKPSLVSKGKDKVKDIVENKEEHIKEIKEVKEKVDDYVADKASKATKFLIDNLKNINFRIPDISPDVVATFVEAYLHYLVWTNRGVKFIPDPRIRAIVKIYLLVTLIGSLDVLKVYADHLVKDGVLTDKEAEILRTINSLAEYGNVREIISKQTRSFFNNPHVWLAELLEPPGTQALRDKTVVPLNNWINKKVNQLIDYFKGDKKVKAKDTTHKGAVTSAYNPDIAQEENLIASEYSLGGFVKSKSLIARANDKAKMSQDVAKLPIGNSPMNSLIGSPNNQQLTKGLIG